jgi:hypothetical protein
MYPFLMKLYADGGGIKARCSPRRGKTNGAGECGDRQAFRSQRIRRPSEAVGRRTFVRMARVVQTPRQRLGESQSQGARIHTPRFNQAHAEESYAIPNDLSGQTLSVSQKSRVLDKNGSCAPPRAGREYECSWH